MSIRLPLPKKYQRFARPKPSFFILILLVLIVLYVLLAQLFKSADAVDAVGLDTQASVNSVQADARLAEITAASVKISAAEAEPTYDPNLIPALVSPIDADGDGIDDYRDIMLGARAWVETEPFYDGSHYGGGYPPDDIGVCTDVLWHAFFAAGYDFKALIDADIDANPAAYQIENRDPNIDFRHTGNVEIFLERHAESLTLDVSDIAAWQPGDLVTYTGHFAIVSDIRNVEGVPYILHQTSNQERSYEIDLLVDAEAQDGGVITGHFRWNG